MNQVTVLKAVIKYKWFVLATTLLLGVLGYAAGGSASEEYVATTSLVLEDPATSSVLADQTVRPAARFVANQLEILQSALVAQRAAELAAADGIEVGITDILRGSAFVPLPNADVIVLTFTSEDPAIAESVPSYIVAAFVEVQREQRRGAAESVLENLTSAEEVLVRALDELDADIDRISDQRGLEEQTTLVLDQIASVQSQLIIAESAEARLALQERLQQLDQQLRTLQLAGEVETTRPEVAGLLQSREQIQTRIADIARRKTEVEIDAETQSTGLVFSSQPAVSSASTGLWTALRVVAGLLVGLVLSSMLAYAYAVYRRSFSSRLEPEAILGSPFLGEIPEFDGSDTLVPVRDDPRSPVAEAFRFVAAAIQLRAERSGHTTVMGVSSTVGDGKSTVLVNTAFAAARTGARVLLIDGDFGNQKASSLVLGDVSLDAGLTELVAGKANLQQAVHRVDLGGGVHLDLMTRGVQPVVAPDFFANRQTQAVFQRLETAYDLVLIDGPPLMQVAYASNLARIAGSTFEIIRHGSQVRAAEELRGRLTFIESNVLGYVYNRSPIRPEMLQTGGSMKDILGDQGFVEGVATRRK